MTDDTPLIIAMEAKTKADVVETRLDRHLVEMKDALKDLRKESQDNHKIVNDKMDIITKAINVLEKDQIRSESKTFKAIMTYGGSGMVGGGIFTGIIEILKFLGHK